MENQEALKNYVAPEVIFIDVVLEQGILQTSDFNPEEGNWQ